VKENQVQSALLALLALKALKALKVLMAKMERRNALIVTAITN
jgi:hypothetical protein